MSDPARLEELRAEARYARERCQLYRARMHAGRPTTMTHMRELERIQKGAEARLRRAQEEDALPNRDRG